MVALTTPSAMISAALRKGLPAGVEFSEGAHAFYKGADYMLTADATRNGFRWCLTDLDSAEDTYFPAGFLDRALASLAAS